MSKDKKVYFISGGGTGGHIYPAVSILQGLLQCEDTEKIYYVGNPKNMEYDIIKQYEEVEFLPVTVSGMPRKVSFDFVKWVCKLEISLWKALFYIKKYKPDVVFTTGGYVSAPIAFMASFLKVPLMIHDCDAVPGLVSKTVAPFANKVSVAFESSKGLLKSKNIICTGNPVRSEFLTVSKEEAREKLGLRNKMTILITGGSQGAQTLNKTAIIIAQEIVEKYDVQLVIQTGKKNYDEFIKKITEYFPNYKMNTNLVIRPYFDEMFYALKSADIVVSRAGSLSLSELNLCGAACILVPYPYAAADHQRKNAREAENIGYALYCEDKDLDGSTLIKMLKSLFENPDKIAKMSEASYKNAKPYAKEEIIKNLKALVK
ncbi:MAG: undecaprenyldiphospho-muramoylpentapeptide beta-N-acetylglucosaminyltransferase [Candidatus Gastranaerophilales bacterium]|nr:undecaprenyldiphospho-muramoylpentapeptide beta-N-acetylglucosaminyltransferase [Candidatus Gastranaerophilales bacterium]